MYIEVYIGYFTIHYISYTFSMVAELFDSKYVEEQIHGIVCINVTNNGVSRFDEFV